MSTLAEIQGQPRAVEVLQSALRSERVPQAYLFAGPRHSGKHTTALAMARALNCLRNPNLGCVSDTAGDVCESCAKIDADSHPDIKTLVPEGKTNTIKIGTIRSEIVAVLGLPPHEGRCRVFLIRDATALQAAAANALLKTLEEPPTNTYFILECVSAVRLLPTIRSRCQRVQFQALAPDLQVAFQNDEDGNAIRAAVDALLKTAEDRGLGTIVDAACDLGDRQTVLATVVQAAQTCHHLACDAAKLGDLPTAQIYGQRATECLVAASAVRDHNAHGQLAVEGLLVALRGLPLPRTL